MDEQFIRDRISSLRQEKQVSERKMSLDLGHSTSYIRSITSGRALPSMSEFLYICEYLGVTPMEFFNEEKATTLTQQTAIEHIYSMSDDDIRLLVTGGVEDIDAACFLETHIPLSFTCYPDLLNTYADLHLPLSSSIPFHSSPVSRN